MTESKYFRPQKYFHFLTTKIKRFFSSLENEGERVDILFSPGVLLNENERCHLARYQFAQAILSKDDHVGDFACGTGYGSIMLAKAVRYVTGIDIDGRVINKIQKKYKNIQNVIFRELDLLTLDSQEEFDTIVSFETIEHFSEKDILKLFHVFHTALKQDGLLIFSTPYMQKDDQKALDMGFHKTFFINEDKISSWMGITGFRVHLFFYQNYQSPEISRSLDKKDFIICIAQKI